MKIKTNCLGLLLLGGLACGHLAARSIAVHRRNGGRMRSPGDDMRGIAPNGAGSGVVLAEVYDLP